MHLEIIVTFAGVLAYAVIGHGSLKNLLLDEKDEAPGEDKFLGNAAEANKIIKLLIKHR